MHVRWTRPTAALAAAVLATSLCVLYAVDPTLRMITPPCPYLTLTGLACPGCGLTRATHFLLHGDVAQAFAYNPWAFVAGPAVLLFTLIPSVSNAEHILRARTGIAWVLLLLTMVFWIWRNTASYPFVRL
jgi:Protein of unknown function (DUF2752)